MNLNRIIIGIFAVSCLCGCSQDEDPTMLAPTFTLGEATDVARNSAVVSGTVTPVGDGVVQECGFVYSTDPALADAKKMKAEGSGSVSVTLGGLLPNTTYYYGLYAYSGFNTAYSQEIKQFKTLAMAKPTLGNIQLKNSSISELVLSCPIADDGGQTFSKVGFRYRIVGTDEWIEVLGSVQDGVIVATITDIVPNTEYEVSVFAEYGTDKTEVVTGTSVKLTTSNSTAHITNMGEGGDL